MANQKPLANDECGVRKLTQEDFANAVPFSELPDKLKELLRSPECTAAPGTEPKKRKRTAA